MMGQRYEKFNKVINENQDLLDVLAKRFINVDENPDNVKTSTLLSIQATLIIIARLLNEEFNNG